MTTAKLDSELVNQLDREAILEAERNPGGHSEVMEVLFKGATVIASHIEDDYEGNLVYVYRLADGRVAVTPDSFGSCCGCDAWDGASDEEAISLTQALARNTRVFDTLTEAINWIETIDEEGSLYSLRPAIQLLPALREESTR